MQHLTLEQLAKYREGRLPGGLLLDADDHIARCEQCRGLLLESASASAQLAAVSQALKGTVDLSAFHLSYQELQDHVEGKTPQAKVEQIEAHLRECESCRLELQDLREFAASLKVTRMPSPKRNRYLLLLPIAAAILMAVALMPSHPKAPVFAISLHEGNAVLALDTAGQPVCPANIQPADCQTLASVLRDRKLMVPAQEELRSSRAALLSAGDAPAAFHVVGPVGKVVLSDRPEFNWQASPGAKSYRVEIFDVNYDPVLTSPELTATSWRPEKALERGKVYAWQVTATGKGDSATAPKPPDPEARFEIVSPRDAEAIEAARKLNPPSHLLLAAKLAAAGLCQEAQAELAILASANPASPIPAQIREDLDKRCTVN